MAWPVPVEDEEAYHLTTRVKIPVPLAAEAV